MRKTRGFTLIELLIVVAIIAILAAIAVPNFLEAQVRSKVSRCRADMRSIATAMEAYCVDWQHYPPYTGPGAPGVGEAHWRLNHLSTPVAYMTSVPNDPFADRIKDPVGWQYHQDAYMYAELQDWGNARTYNEARARGQKWFLTGRGPNLVFDCHAEFGGVEGGETEYDATNGTRSRGDLERFGP
jgi:prepilin-type N-terminal cleavage/methylation domain-containing protein